MKYISKLLRKIDDHPGTTEGGDGTFHDSMLKKFEAEGNLSNREVARLERILERLDQNYDPTDIDF